MHAPQKNEKVANYLVWRLEVTYVRCELIDACMRHMTHVRLERRAAAPISALLCCACVCHKKRQKTANSVCSRDCE